jgi:uncharacterized zinc-type alcohol dehydrogenase-like protein
MRDRASGSPSSGSAASGTWRSRSPTRWAPRSRCCRSRCASRRTGLKLGADAYYATSDDVTFDELAGRFDLIVNTVSAGVDIGRFLSLLRTSGTLVNVGAPPEPLPVPAFALIPQRRSFAGSAIGGIRETQEMLDFCADHGIAAEIEVISADHVNDARERVLNSDVRYRFVIDNSTL